MLTPLRGSDHSETRSDKFSNCFQAAMVGELYRLAEKSQKKVQKPTGQGRLLQWYFFLVTAFWMYFR